MNSPEIIGFIKKHKSWWWSVPEEKKEFLSEGSVVEATLNYGNLNDIKELLEIMGYEKVADIFFDKISKPRNNFFPRSKHFFELYFKRHVQKYSDK